jgi:hypothetical protein
MYVSNQSHTAKKTGGKKYLKTNGMANAARKSNEVLAALTVSSDEVDKSLTVGSAENPNESISFLLSFLLYS